MRLFLYPLSLLFQFLVQMRKFIYAAGLMKTRKVDRPVICIGNLSTGGTGKTPWVHKLTEHFFSKNKKSVVLSRGYSGDFDGVLKVTPDMDPRKCGDEPLWLSRNTCSYVYVGRSRVKSAEKAIAEENPDLFILDDGFQHFAIDREVDIVLLDASAPLKNYHYLPLGRMREGFSSLQRAQVVVINKCNYGHASTIDFLDQQCEKYKNKESIFHSDYVFDCFEPLVSELERDNLKDPVTMTCALGNPDAFAKTLSEQDISIARKFIFPDHYFWKPVDVEKITYHMRQDKSRDLVITEKDAVKLVRYKKHFQELEIQVWVCKMKIQLREDKNHFFSLIERTLEAKSENT